MVSKGIRVIKVPRLELCGQLSTRKGFESLCSTVFWQLSSSGSSIVVQIEFSPICCISAFILNKNCVAVHISLTAALHEIFGHLI